MNDNTWYKTAMQAWDQYKDLTILGDQNWYSGNTNYARMLWLDAMGCLDDSYRECGVEMPHEP